MINPVTKKLRKEIKELQEDVGYQTRLKRGVAEELSAAKGKLQVYESQVLSGLRGQQSRESTLIEQNQWLRSIVEGLVIKPEIVKAHTTKRIRLAELEILKKKAARPGCDGTEPTANVVGVEFQFTNSKES